MIDGDVCDRFQERTSREETECGPDPPAVDLYEAAARLPDCSALHLIVGEYRDILPQAALERVVASHRSFCSICAAIAAEDLLMCPGCYEFTTIADSRTIQASGQWWHTACWNLERESRADPEGSVQTTHRDAALNTLTTIARAAKELVQNWDDCGECEADYVNAVRTALEALDD